MTPDGISRAAAVGGARGPERRDYCFGLSGCVTWLVLLMVAPHAAQVSAQDAAADPGAAPAPAPDPGAAATPAANPSDANAAPADAAAANGDANKPAATDKPDAEKTDASKTDERPTADADDKPKPKPPAADSDERLESEEQEPAVDIAARLGSGFMRGGKGGLTTAQREPFTLDIEVVQIKDARWLFGGALRIELEAAKAVAGIARVALRHPMGSLELRPGAGIPFYFAPRTMLGVEGSCAFRLPLSDDGLGLSGSASAAAFIVGSDIPHGSTVIMFHVFIGVDLLL